MSNSIINLWDIFSLPINLTIVEDDKMAIRQGHIELSSITSNYKERKE